MTNPMLPSEYRNVISAKVTIGKHCLIGTGSTILPGCDIGEGTAIGSMSLITESVNPWSIYAGIPAKKIKDREKEILNLEKKFLNSLNS